LALVREIKEGCEGQKIIQTGLPGELSLAVYQQFIHGTQYIDELVMVRVAGKGDLYVHQDANWNVIGLTDVGHHLVEHYKFTPYGELTVDQDTGFGDRDGDSIVNSTDRGTVGVTCTGTVTGACRILDLDFDGDYDSTDATKFDSLPSGSQKRPGKQSTGVSQSFAHQGMLLEPEIASYQNRARQYDPAKRRFAQRDPLNGRFEASSTRWGDVETPYNPPSSIGQPDFSDIASFQNRARQYDPEKRWLAEGEVIASRHPAGPQYLFVEANPIVNVDFDGEACTTWCQGQWVPCGSVNPPKQPLPASEVRRRRILCSAPWVQCPPGYITGDN
jgi:RHS repeat-associated protein